MKGESMKSEEEVMKGEGRKNMARIGKGRKRETGEGEGRQRGDHVREERANVGEEGGGGRKRKGGRRRRRAPA
jgi:hypothetical protein